MASLIICAGALAYDQVQQKRARKKARRVHNEERFSELEKANSDRIAALQQNTCFCQRSDWQGGGCEVHGYVPPADAAIGGDTRTASGGNIVEGDVDRSIGQGERDQPPEYLDVVETAEEYGRDRRDRGLVTEGWTERPPEMDEEDIEKINEERRKRMKASQGYKRWFGRKWNAPT